MSSVAATVTTAGTAQGADLRPMTGNEAIARGAWEAGVRLAKTL